jgi:membrane protein DedA with SNARE-associated domain
MWYLLGRRIGEQRFRRWVDRHGRWLTLSGSDVDGAQDWFRRHGASAVLLGRMVPGVRTFISLPAGFTAMPLGRFLSYSALGTAAWTSALAGAGLLLEANFTRVAGYVDAVSYGLLGLLGAMLIRRYVRCWRQRRA